MPRRTSLTTEARSSMVCPTEVVFCNDTLRTKGTRGMQSWIHVIEWRANVRPELTALDDYRAAAYTHAHLPATTESRAGGWSGLLVGGTGPGDFSAVVS